MIKKCLNCNRYTLKEKCPECGNENLVKIHPPSFSPKDKFLLEKFHVILNRKKIKV